MISLRAIFQSEICSFFKETPPFIFSFYTSRFDFSYNPFLKHDVDISFVLDVKSTVLTF